MPKTLYIIRGIPGSGKSTLANKLTFNVCEADQYFMKLSDKFNEPARYVFNAQELPLAHEACRLAVKHKMQINKSVIAVANTFVKREYMQPYIDLANEYGYMWIEIICKGNFQSVHNVPQETIERMKQQFEY